MVRLGQVRRRRPMDYVAVRVEPRAVAGAIPRSLRRIPRDKAAHMRTDRRALVYLGVLIAIRGDLVLALDDDSALTVLDSLCRARALLHEALGDVRARTQVVP